jgi:hypothetical protein
MWTSKNLTIEHARPEAVIEGTITALFVDKPYRAEVRMWKEKTVYLGREHLGSSFNIIDVYVKDIDSTTIPDESKWNELQETFRFYKHNNKFLISSTGIEAFFVLWDILDRRVLIEKTGCFF